MFRRAFQAFARRAWVLTLIALTLPALSHADPQAPAPSGPSSGSGGTDSSTAPGGNSSSSGGSGSGSNSTSTTNGSNAPLGGDAPKVVGGGSSGGSSLSAPLFPVRASVFRTASEKVAVFFDDFKIFDTDAEIDKAVGDPWELGSTTASKLALLPLYLRYPIYLGLSGRLGTMDPNALSDIVDREIPRGDAYAIQAVTGTTERVRDSVLGILGDSFSIQEIADLVVYGLAQAKFFPKTEEGWRRVKEYVVDSDVFIAAAVLLAGALTDQGTFRHNGKLVNIDKKGFKLGWYGSVRNLGVHFKPRLAGGVTTTFAHLQVSAGVSHRFIPSAGESDTALEIALREGWLDRFASPKGWSFYSEAAVRMLLVRGDLYQGAVTRYHLGLNARKQEVSFIPGAAFIASAAAETTSQRNMRFALSAALESSQSGLAALFQSALVHDPRTGRWGGQAGLYVAGSFVSTLAHNEDEMRSRGGLLTGAIESYQAEAKSVAEAEARLNDFGTNKMTAEEAQERIEELREALITREGKALELGRRLADYLDARHGLATALRGKNGTKRKVVEEEVGSMDQFQLAEAQALFDSRTVGLAESIRQAEQGVARAVDECAGLERELKAAYQDRSRNEQMIPVLEDQYKVCINERHKGSQRLGGMLNQYDVLQSWRARICKRIYGRDVLLSAKGPVGPSCEDPLGHEDYVRAKRLGVAPLH